MDVVKSVMTIFAALLISPALAQDPGRGKSLAQDHCSPCHIVAPLTRNEVADAPPFDLIGRRYGFDQLRLMQAIRGPHPKMNFSPDPSDAAAIAAYIASLAN
jgi:cytochrome c